MTTATKFVYTWVPSVDLYLHIHFKLKCLLEELTEKDASFDTVSRHLKSIEVQFRKHYYSLEEMQDEKKRYLKTILPDLMERVLLRSTLRKRGHPYKDFALTFLVFSLVYDLTPITKVLRRDRYSLIAEFLDDMGIAKIGYEEVKKRYQRAKEEKILKMLSLCDLALSRRTRSLFLVGFSKNRYGFVGILKQHLNMKAHTLLSDSAPGK